MGVLDAAQRAQLYAWLDRFLPTSINASDPGVVADGLTRTAELAGNGQMQASDDDKRAIYDFGQVVFRGLYP